jgi:hypothetical protein
MLLDNHLIVKNKNNEEMSYISSPTTSVGCNIPKSWLACFKEDDAVITEEGNLLLVTSVKEALSRLDVCVNHFIRIPPFPSEFSQSILDELIETIYFITQYIDCELELFFGCYGDRVSLDKFKKTCGAGKISLYSDSTTVILDIDKELSKVDA